MTDAETILGNYETLRRRLDLASGRAGVPELMPVTKTVAPERIACLRQVGVRAIGENRVNEALEKRAALGDDFDIHIIGRLQTNKAAQAARLAQMVQSLDRLPLAEALETALTRTGRQLDALVQVNIGRDPAKAGIFAEDAEAFLARLQAYPHLRVRGLMTVAPLTETPEGARPYFRALKALFERLKRDPRFAGQMEILSMGMSADCEIAAQEGATLVRVGAALFGKRDNTIAPGLSASGAGKTD